MIQPPSIRVCYSLIAFDVKEIDLGFEDTKVMYSMRAVGLSPKTSLCCPACGIIACTRTHIFYRVFTDTRSRLNGKTVPLYR